MFIKTERSRLLGLFATKGRPKLSVRISYPMTVYKTVNKEGPDPDLGDVELQKMGKTGGDTVHPEEDKAKIEGLTFWELFMFAQPADMSIFWLGVVGTALAGATLPGRCR